MGIGMAPTPVWFHVVLIYIINNPPTFTPKKLHLIDTYQIICYDTYMKCLQCGIEFESKRDTAKFCSPKCRVTYNRTVTLTSGNVTLSEPDVTLNFKFTIAQYPGSKPGDKDWNENKGKVRTEMYWYNIPLAAIPVYEKDWPKMPDYMNGRQYFLWWKNEFQVGETGEPVILNPFPEHTNVRYELAGEGSRRWGA